MSHKDITIKIEELKKKKLSAETQMKFLSANLEKMNKELEELENQAWFFGDDEVLIDDIVVCCNYSSWKKAKEMKYDRVFYIQDNSLGGAHYVTLSKQEVVELIEYVQEKIDYLETEEDEA